jgi:hypothetical protein
MLVTEITKPFSSKILRDVIDKQFGGDSLLLKMNVNKASSLLEKVCKNIDTYRSSDNYFACESDAKYLKMLTVAKYLSEYIKENEKNIILEKDTDTTAMYQQGIKKGVGHTIDTARKFVPHATGSALGAFVGGLKGQSLQSEHGQVKITNLEAELGMVDPKNRASVSKFVDKQMTEHFKEYKDPATKKIITDFMNQLYKDGSSGKKQTPESIAAALTNLPNKPFKNITDKKLMTDLVKYFFSIYKGASAASVKSTIRATQNVPSPNSPVLNDTVSALQNLGYPRKNAIEAVRQAVEKNPNITKNFDSLLRAAQLLIRK